MRGRLIFLFAVLLAAGLAWAAQNFRAHISSDPTFCAKCHEASADLKSWSSATHARLACQKCHHNSTGQGVAMLAKFMLGGRPDAREHRMRIGDCAGCHLSHDRMWKDVGAARGHRVHAVGEKIACTRCHGADAHRIDPQVPESFRECFSCHPTAAGHAKSLACTSCHIFRAAPAN